jgi:hypothetical protein
MIAHTWQGIIVALMSLNLLMGCASSPYVGTGAAVGGSLGALTGAAIANRNPWAGAVVGGLVGSALGAAGGYVVQQRQQPYGPSQGYYPAQPGYGAPAPPAYGHHAPSPGPSYGYHAPTPATPPDPGYGWETPAPVTPPEPGYNSGLGPPAYSQAPPPSRLRTPIAPAPYISQEALE